MIHRSLRSRLNVLILAILVLPSAALSADVRAFAPGMPAPRNGDEIIVCGQLFHTGTPVVTWLDPGGYDAYRIEKHFPSTAPAPTSRGSRQFLRPSYSTRMAPLSDDEVERVRGGNWTLDLLREKVDQFVIHYDVCGLSSICFKVLHDQRGLSVHFMLDIDGTIYQTMDLKEEAWHATESNGRSIGVEIANLGAYPMSASTLPLHEWYVKDPTGVRIAIPARVEDPHLRTPNFVGRPIRSDLVSGMIQGYQLRQYDFTPQQYESLIRLTATLCTVFPKITCDYPRQKSHFGAPTTTAVSKENPATPGDPTTLPSALAATGEPGVLIPHALSDEQLENYQGVLGHYHVQTDKQDPGPAFQWDRVINSARNLMTSQARIANAKARGKPAKHIPSTRRVATTQTT